MCDREVELASLNATDSKLSHLKSALFNNPELFNWLFKDESLYVNQSDNDFYNRLKSVFDNYNNNKD